MTVQETKATTPLRGVAFEERDGCRVIATTSLNYEDGGEARVLEAIRSAADKSSLSEDLERKATTWAERYHLSKSRANLLRPFDLNKTMRVLDVGGGCGAIARYLGETCGEVDVLEPMPARAAVARARTRDLANVEIFVGEIDAVPQEPAYDLITVVGVLEYVGLGSTTDDPYIEFLGSLARRLLPGGVILLAIENRLGVKYLAGAPEDHSGRPFDGLEGYRSGGPARTFTRLELEQLLRHAGLSSDFYHAFPDYKLPRVLFHEEIFRSGPEQPLAWRVPYFPSPDWSHPREPWVDEEFLWRSLVQSGVGQHFSNSFVVVASPANSPVQPVWNGRQLAAFYTTGRRAPFTTETRASREADNAYFRRRILTGTHLEVDAADVTLRVEGSRLIEGQPLLEILADANEAEMAQWMQRWAEMVEATDVTGGVPIDLVPGNILVDESDALHAIDQEWYRGGADKDEILQRGVIWLAHNLAGLTPPDRWTEDTVEELAIGLGSLVGLSRDSNWLPAAFEREVEFQTLVHVCDPDDPRWTSALDGLREILAQRLKSARLADGPLGPRRGFRGQLEDEQTARFEAEQTLILERARERQRAERSKSKIARLENRLNEQAAYVGALEAQIRSITGSTGYRLVQRARKPLNWAAPVGSTRRSIVSLPTKAVRVARRDGPSAVVRKASRIDTWRRVFRQMSAEREPSSLPDLNVQYEAWLQKHKITPPRAEAIQRAAGTLTYRPLVSIVTPVYNPELSWLRDAIDSVRNQLYDNWELCLADDCSTRPGVRELLAEYATGDPRIKVTLLDTNRGIGGASDAALALASGEFVGLLDHDDILRSDALYEVAKLLNERPEIDFIYSDEDKLSEGGKHVDPFFKPDWSPETLLSMNYVTHFAVYRKTLLDRIGGFRTGYDGSQDYDLALRATEQSREIGHINKPIYTWRMVPGSAAASTEAKPYAYEAARRAIDDAMNRRGVSGRSEHGMFTGSYRVRYKVDPSAKVSIVIPTRDRVDLLRRCITSIRRKSSFRNYDITIIDNDSVDPETLQYFKAFKGKVAKFQGDFNFSAIVNFGATQVDGDYILFLNNDTEVITSDWIEALLEEAQKPDVGAVGAALLFPDGTPQHHGIVIRMAGPAANVDATHYFGLDRVVRNVSAVTAACMMVRRAVFEALGGFDEEMAVAYNDVDFCLRALGAGHRVVYTPFAQLYHHESATRGAFSPSENSTLFERRWLKDRSYIDPYYNPNLDLGMPYTIKV